MTERENYLSIIRRKGFSHIPFSFNLCPYLRQQYGERLEKFRRENGIIPPPEYYSKGICFKEQDESIYRAYYKDLKEGAQIDLFGVGHEPGSAAAMHMTHMRHPLEHMESLSELKAYPYPEILKNPRWLEEVRLENRKAKAEDKVVVGDMQCTVWERAWYMRSMERLMMDMVCEQELAAYVLDTVTEVAIKQAEFYAESGCDILFFGDDVGMQQTVVMSEELYVSWLKPRLKAVVAAARKLNPDIVIFYHSCGFVEPFIGHLIEAGVDVLNPVQPECMDFEELHKKYGDRVSFHGTIGTQSTMPFGSPEQVREQVFNNLKIAGAKGGLLPVPTHLLEPEVPTENIEAYMLACHQFKL